MAAKKPARKNASTRRLSRRRFMALIAGGVLAASRPARAIAPSAPSKPKSPTPKSPTRSAAIEKGIAEQKGALAKQLKTLRDFPLSMGSDPAFLFRPVSPRRLK